MMVKHISFVHRAAGMTHEEFLERWKNLHAPLVKARLPGLRKYVGSIPCRPPGSNASMPGSGAQLQCDLVVELHFDDLASLQMAMSGPGWLSDERMASSAALMDLTRHQFIVAEEYLVSL
jgi:uncharacterized protein (TIGR02118 family)